MTFTKDKLTGLTATLGIHALLLLTLVFYYIKPGLPRSSEELSGIPVMFGTSPDASGNEEPLGGNPEAEEVVSQHAESQTIASQKVVPSVAEVAKTEKLPKPEKIEKVEASKPIAKPKEATKSPVHMQDNERTATAPTPKPNTKAIEEQKAIEAQRAEAARKAEAEKATRQAEAERVQKATEIKNRTAGLFGKGTAGGTGRGETSGNGTQGVPTGNASKGKTSGVGGMGTYDLGGRGLGSGGLVQPRYNVDDYGTVVVDILVNPQGEVVEATVGRGTNTPSTSLRQEALRAARLTKFSAVKTSGNQKGTITYKFNLK